MQNSSSKRDGGVFFHSHPATVDLHERDNAIDRKTKSSTTESGQRLLILRLKKTGPTAL
jgi:hypothetical protein